MQELLFLLGNLIVMLLAFQIMFFEINYQKVRKSNNVMWYLSLDKSFNYNRTGYMAFLCFLCYLLFNSEPMFSLNWFLYFLLFLALGIISDVVVQYLTLHYGKMRCKNQIREAKVLEEEILKLKDLDLEYNDYFQPEREIDELAVLRKYLKEEDHLAFLSVDQGKLALEFSPLPAVTYDVEPYGNIESIRNKFEELQSPVKVTTLTQSQQMPFKDDKMDIVMNQLCNYDKNEVKRVLKPEGLFILHQNGTGNLKEIVDMYVPFRMKGEWTLNTCIPTLESVGFKVLEGFEDYNYIQFRSIESLYTYFKNTSKELCDIVRYKAFYMSVLQQIKETGSFKLSTYDFLIVAQKKV